MIQKIFQRALPSIAQIGSDPNDDDDIRLVISAKQNHQMAVNALL